MRRIIPAVKLECIIMVLQTVEEVWRDQSGATVVDYGIVFLLLAIIAATAFETFGDYLASMLSLGASG